MKRSLLSPLLTIALIIVSTTMIAYAQDDATGTRNMMRFGTDTTVCTQDARRCPDGSFVGRTGPRCEFAACPGETRENIQSNRAEFQQNMEARQEAFQARMNGFREEKIAIMINLMKRRFTAAIGRLENIADRIETRIEKIEDATDTDLSDARDYLSDAREHINTAEDLLDDAGTSTAASLFDNASTTLGNRFGILRELFADAKEELQAARALLSDALRSMGQSRDTTLPATTTSSN